MFITVFGIILRFIHTPDRYTIDGDSIRDAIIAMQGAKTLSFPLSGPFSSTGPYTFGPWYYIILIFISLLFRTPYAPWMLMGIISIFTIPLMADIGRLLYSKRLGIILATITALAPTQLSVATSLSNLSPVPFFATLSIWITLKLLKKEFTHVIWYITFGLILGFSINAHYQMVGLLLLPLILWFMLGWRKFQFLLFFSLGFILTFLPLLFFNLLTNGHTISGIKEMYIAKERTYVPNSWSIYLFQFWPSHIKFLFSIPIAVSIIWLFAGVVSFCSDVIKKNYSQGLNILIFVFLCNFLWLRFYWDERHDVYLYYLTPLVIIFLGYTLDALFRFQHGKIFFVLLACIFGWSMFANDYSRVIDTTGHSLWEKEAKLLLERYPKNNVVLYTCDPYYGAHKKALVYLLNFHYQQGAPEKIIGMKGNECLYPNITGYNFRDSKTNDTFGNIIYPSIFTKKKDSNFDFYDFSIASPSAIAEAGWSIVRMEDVFNESVNWWKK